MSILIFQLQIKHVQHRFALLNTRLNKVQKKILRYGQVVK